MEISKPTVAELFDQRRRFVVPLYQREYVWNADEHWSYLWDDIRSKTLELMGADGTQPIGNHFMGALVLLPQAAVRNILPYKEVIDGQQRLTSMQIVLKALRDVAAALNVADVEIDLRRLTTNEGRMEDPDIERHKVWPTFSDQPHYIAVAGAQAQAEIEDIFPANSRGRRQIPSKGIAAAYLYFCDEFTQFFKSDEDGNDHEADEVASRVNETLTALQNHFHFVCIDLDANDDPQVIFEALNGRGAPLLPSDLIKNFVFQAVAGNALTMRTLYERHWEHFDAERVAGNGDRFWKVEVKQGRLKRPRIDLFLFHYLQCRKRQDVLITELFRTFKDWWRSDASSVAETAAGRLEHLAAESGVFHGFFSPNIREETGLRLKRINAMDTNTVYPFLLYLFGEAHRAGRVQNLAAVLQLVESYLVRRFVCRLTTKKYNYVFMQLLRNVAEGEATIDADAIAAQLRGFEGVSVEWPSDDAFRTAWMENAIYASGRASTVLMMLSALDNELQGDGREPVEITYDQLWIEHVMPQSWEAHWPLPEPEAGPTEQDAPSPAGPTPEETRNRLIHTFGNLTLLTENLNRDLKNSDYASKRPRITQNSALAMNTYFQSRDSWDENEIIARGEALFDVALNLWPGP